jgi:hypothetical protein
MAWIETPVICLVKIFFFNQLVFDIPQFLQFVYHTELLTSLEQASLSFDWHSANVTLHQPKSSNSYPEDALSINIECYALDWQISGLAQICNQFLPFYSSVEQLHIDCNVSKPVGSSANSTCTVESVAVLYR